MLDRLRRGIEAVALHTLVSKEAQGLAPPASDVEGAPIDLFSGWMFASSPAVSALEHPVYDIWVVDCAEPMAPIEGVQGVPEMTGPSSE